MWQLLSTLQQQQQIASKYAIELIEDTSVERWIEDDDEEDERFLSLISRSEKKSSALENVVILISILTDNLTFIHRHIWCLDKATDWYDYIVPQMDDKAFKENFRVTKKTFDFLVDSLQCLKKQDTNFRKAIPVRKRIAVALFYLSSAAEYRVISALFGIGKSTACEIVDEFCSCVIKLLMPKFVKFPQTVEQLRVGVQEFEMLLGYPMCIGAVDGCHIRICPPKESAIDYYNFKGSHSIILFAVADARYRYIYFNVGSPGKNSDSNVLKKTSLNKALESNLFDSVEREMGNAKLPVCLIGDSAFPLSKHLMKPYAESLLMSEEQKFYNLKLCGARRIIENVFGRTKARFRRVYKNMEGDIPKLKKIILACCVLNNICEYFNDDCNSEWFKEMETIEQLGNSSHQPTVSKEGDNGPGQDLRNSIAKYLFENR